MPKATVLVSTAVPVPLLTGTTRPIDTVQEVERGSVERALGAPKVWTALTFEVTATLTSVINARVFEPERPMIVRVPLAPLSSWGNTDISSPPQGR